MSDAVFGVDVLMAHAARAKAGELVLDPTVAQDCAKACTEAIASLRGVKDDMTQRAITPPLGDFTCGDDLSKILTEVTQQFVDRLDEHIVCLKAIHDTVGAQVADTLTTDEATGQALARVTGAIAS